MNTPAHLIMGAAVFGKPDIAKVTFAAILGGLLPDLSLYALGGWELFIKGTPPDVVFAELYFSDSWQQTFAIDNSFVLWGIAFGLALWLRSAWAIALCGSALLHLAFDFPLHNEDARMHFWPITDWKFYAPFSYWDSNSGGQYIGVAEAILSTAMVAYLVWVFRSIWWRILFIALLIAEFRTVWVWIKFF